MKPGEATTGPERLAEAAIAAVVEWSGATIDYRDVTMPVMSPMHRNVDSLCFAVDVDGAANFLKIVHPELRGEIDPGIACTAARAAADIGVAPRVLDWLPDHDAIVFERLGEGWRTARTDDLRRIDTMARVVEARKRLQAGQAFGRPWSVFEGIRGIMAGASIPDGVAGLVQGVGEIEKVIAAAGSDSRPCHADGLASNVMIEAGGAVRLVDFDQACDTDPYYDLGILLNEAYVFDEEMAPALECFEGSLRQASLARCRLYGIADDLHWGLWSHRMSIRSGRTAVEFLKYAHWRFLRCRIGLEEPAFGNRMRMI